MLYHLNLYDWHYANDVESLMYCYVLCETSGESRIGVNNRTVHCSAKSKIWGLFCLLLHKGEIKHFSHCLHTQKPSHEQRRLWNWYERLGVPREHQVYPADEYGLQMRSWFGVKGQMDLFQIPRNSSNLVNPSGGFFCVKLYLSSQSTISIFTYI